MKHNLRSANVTGSTASRLALGELSLTSALATAGTGARAHPIVIGLGAAAAACAVVGALAIERGQLRGHSSTYAAVTILAGASFVVAGLTAWSRRSERWTGALMVGSGFVLFTGALVEANRSLPYTVGLAVILIPNAVLAHLVLAFPAGRLHSMLERLLVAGAYLTAVVLQVVMLMFMGVGDAGGCPCPSNLLFVREEMNLHATLMDAERYAGIGIAAGVGVVLAQRWLAASPLLRRALAPILVTGGVTSALLGAMFFADQTSASVSANLESAARVTLATVPLAYLFGLFRARLARADISDLVVELGRAPEPGRLRMRLPAPCATRPSSSATGVRAPRNTSTSTGDTSRSVTPVATRTVTLLERHGRRVAALVHDAALSEDTALLDGVASAAGLALENERLLAELRSQLEEIKSSRTRIIEAGITERRRLERNLHDGAQQRLVTLSLHLRMAQELMHDDPAEAETMFDRVGDDLKQALEELRELARGLHPAVLTDRGLAPALQSLANRAPLPVEITGVPTLRLPEAVEAAIYYVVAESLTNTAKYADASHAHVELSTPNSTVVVEIRDDGKGGAMPTGGSGIRGLADRIEALGGSFELASAVGAGTVVRATLPAG